MLKTVFRWVMTVCVCLGMTVVLIRGVQPDLTPEQIVQLDSYEGAQQARRIFNLNSVRKDSVKLPGVSDSVAGLAEASVRLESESGISTAVVLGSALPGTGIEVPAAAKSSREPAVMPKSVPVVVVRPSLSGPLFDRHMAADLVAPRMLPVYSVVVESVQLREAPSYDSRPVKSVSRSQTVTLFSTRGQWVEVAANDGSGVAGFVPRSTVIMLKP